MGHPAERDTKEVEIPTLSPQETRRQGWGTRRREEHKVHRLRSG